MITALSGLTDAQELVIATRPARAAFKLMPASGLPNLIQDVNMARTAPVVATRWVLTKIMAMSLLAAVVDPGLKPNQPNQRINTPRAASGMFMYIIISYITNMYLYIHKRSKLYFLFLPGFR
jgi:hypothetical protein